LFFEPEPQVVYIFMNELPNILSGSQIKIQIYIIIL